MFDFRSTQKTGERLCNKLLDNTLKDKISWKGIIPKNRQPDQKVK
jgi:hypothetical protein